MHHSWIFDVRVTSEPELPELVTCPGGAADITVHLGEPPGFEAQSFQTTFEWLGNDGATFCLCRRHAGAYLFDFPGFGRFHIAPRGVVHCMPRDDVDWPTFRYLLINWILIRYVGTLGRLIVHASAVTLSDGRSVAFMGESKFGKSTLASSFLGDRASLLDDDCILLKPDAHSVSVIGAYPGIRLWPESVAALFGDHPGFGKFTPQTEKRQWILPPEVAGDWPAWRRLDALFLLNDPMKEPSDHLRIRQASGSKVAMAMLRSAFNLDPMDRQTMADTFRRTGAAIGEGVRVYELAYPREHARLQEVRQAVGEMLLSG